MLFRRQTLAFSRSQFDLENEFFVGNVETRGVRDIGEFLSVIE